MISFDLGVLIPAMFNKFSVLVFSWQLIMLSAVLSIGKQLSSIAFNIIYFELTKYTALITNLQTELSATRGTHNQLLKEVEEGKESLHELSKAHQQEMQSTKTLLQETENNYQLLVKQSIELKEEVKKYQEAARKSYQNYQHELQLHAESEKLLKTTLRES